VIHTILTSFPVELTTGIVLSSLVVDLKDVLYERLGWRK
jgi:hypothetical protein